MQSFFNSQSNILVSIAYHLIRWPLSVLIFFTENNLDKGLKSGVFVYMVLIYKVPTYIEFFLESTSA